MTRTVSATITAAIAENVTQPVYLISMGWDTVSPDVPHYIATWSADIPWNAITWLASGVNVRNLDGNGGVIEFPNGDDDPWLDLITTQDPVGRAISIYEHQTDFTGAAADATLLFTGLMDGSTITSERITIEVIEGLQNKAFPVASIDPTVYTKLLKSGQRMYWGPDIVMVR